MTSVRCSHWCTRLGRLALIESAASSLLVFPEASAVVPRSKEVEGTKMDDQLGTLCPLRSLDFTRRWNAGSAIHSILCLVRGNEVDKCCILTSRGQIDLGATGLPRRPA